MIISLFSMVLQQEVCPMLNAFGPQIDGIDGLGLGIGLAVQDNLGHLPTDVDDFGGKASGRVSCQS